MIAKLAYRAAGQSSGWFKTMDKVDGYGTAAWSCAAPGSVLRSEYATFAIHFCQGDDVLCSRTFRASVDQSIINVSPGTDEGDALKVLQKILASLNEQQEKFDAAERKREQDFNTAVDKSKKATSAAEQAASDCTTVTNSAKDLLPLGLCITNGRICQRIKKEVTNG